MSGVVGNLIIISSPSGGGKGTLIREILKKIPNIGYSVSLTTRASRPGEVDGVDYKFVTLEEFNSFRDNGGFLEYAEVHGNYYGTSLAFISEMTGSGKDVILEIDVQGASDVLQRVPEALSIFILPPSYDALAARLTRRNTESSEQLRLRLHNSFGEVSRYSEFRYVVVNDDISEAVERLGHVILADRQRRTRQKAAIQDILNSFDTSKQTVK